MKPKDAVSSCAVFLFTCCVLLAGSTVVSGQTCVVYENGSGAYPTVQAAINAGCAVIELANGTFTGNGNRDIDFGGRAITVRSQSGNPADVTIDCEGSSSAYRRGFYFHSGEGPNSVVEGITITGGHWGGLPIWEGGGAIACSSSSPTIRDCIIYDNKCQDGLSVGCGGGMYCLDSSPTVTNCSFIDNNSYTGGGLFCQGTCSPTVTGCTFSGNSSAQYGGAIGLESSISATITDCMITGNNCGYNGGGIFCRWSSSTSITGCTISGNSTTGYGGGICCYGGSSPTITDCLISGNLAMTFGGAIYCESSSATVTGCTISGNQAMYRGGGIHCQDNSSVWLDHTILWGDCETNPEPGDWGDEVYFLDAQSSVRFNCCCVDSSGIAGPGAVNWVPVNIFTDPLFCVCDFADCTQAPTTEGSYWLQECSPCVNVSGCGQVGVRGIGCVCGGGPTAAVPATWSRLKALFNP
jgi:parallel beta-helix repeat protein/predicted outer membrane repeat protein